jgi:hypothetical protein
MEETKKNNLIKQLILILAIAGLSILVFMLGYTNPKGTTNNLSSPFTSSSIVLGGIPLERNTQLEIGTFKFIPTNIIINPYQALGETATIQQMQNAGVYPKYK